MSQLKLHVLGNCCYLYATYRNKNKFEVDEFLFCESLQTTAVVTDAMNVIKDFFEKHDISLWKNWVGVYWWCTGYGCKSGFVALLKNMIPT